MPVPLIVSEAPAFVVMVKGLKAAFGLNTTPFTSMDVRVEMEIPVVLDKSKVAVSDAPLGTVPELQLLPVFQAFEGGLCFQVPLPA